MAETIVTVSNSSAIKRSLKPQQSSPVLRLMSASSSSRSSFSVKCDLHVE